MLITPRHAINIDIVKDQHKDPEKKPRGEHCTEHCRIPSELSLYIHTASNLTRVGQRWKWVHPLHDPRATSFTTSPFAFPPLLLSPTNSLPTHLALLHQALDPPSIFGHWPSSISNLICSPRPNTSLYRTVALSAERGIYRVKRSQWWENHLSSSNSCRHE